MNISVYVTHSLSRRHSNPRGTPPYTGASHSPNSYPALPAGERKRDSLSSDSSINCLHREGKGNNISEIQSPPNSVPRGTQTDASVPHKSESMEPELDGHSRELRNDLKNRHNGGKGTFQPSDQNHQTAGEPFQRLPPVSDKQSLFMTNIYPESEPDTQRAERQSRDVPQQETSPRTAKQSPRRVSPSRDSRVTNKPRGYDTNRSSQNGNAPPGRSIMKDSRHNAIRNKDQTSPRGKGNVGDRKRSTDRDKEVDKMYWPDYIKPDKPLPADYYHQKKQPVLSKTSSSKTGNTTVLSNSNTQMEIPDKSLSPQLQQHSNSQVPTEAVFLQSYSFPSEHTSANTQQQAPPTADVPVTTSCIYPSSGYPGLESAQSPSPNLGYPGSGYPSSGFPPISATDPVLHGQYISTFPSM